MDKEPEFERFFEQFEGNSRNAKPRTQRSLGTGFLISSDGYIVTNYHVVGDADTVKVTLYNGDSYDAQYIGGDEDYDIAVIKIEATDLPNVTLGNSDSLNVGDHVLAIGNPLGELGGTVTGGMISALNRSVTIQGSSSVNTMSLIQMDASVSPGNSGGGLFNMNGELVGVVNDVIFKGVHFEMHVECEGREWLIHSTRACTPGETIGMRIGPNEIHIMSRSEG